MATDVMVDLETMSTRGNAAFVSIGAVAFEPSGTMVQKIGSSIFYQNVDLQSCMSLGLHVDASTIMWWLRQSDAARKALTDPTPQPVELVLKAFSQWYARVTSKESFIWSHGNSFDVPIISECYARIGMKTPWFFSRSHDTRTIFDYVGEKIPAADIRTGGHNSLFDAIAQAEHLQRCLSRLKVVSLGRDQDTPVTTKDVPLEHAEEEIVI